MSRFDESVWFLPLEERVSVPYRPAYPGDDWNNHWVRSRPHRTAPFEPNRKLFPHYLIPALAHPALAHATPGAVRALEAHHLLRYTSFTEWVELSAVVPASSRLAQRDFIAWLPDELRLDQLRVLTDEGGHAEFSRVLLLDIESATGVRDSTLPPAADNVLRRELAALPEDLRPLIQVFWAVTTETLITGTLTAATKDRSLPTRLRETLKDHSDDEAVHHRAFSELTRVLWPNLTPWGKQAAARTIARAIPAYLSVDVPWLAAVLDELALVREPIAVANEVAASALAQNGIRKAGAPSLKLLEQLGAFNVPSIVAEFESAGLR